MNCCRLSVACIAFLLLLSACGGGSSPSPPPIMGGAVQGKVLSLSQVVSTFSGPVPSLDGTGSEAVFRNPYAVTTDGTHLFVADSWNQTIRKVVITTGAVSTLAGSTGNVGSTDGMGLSARFSYPSGITTDGTNLFVSDSSNHTIRRIEIATGAVMTLCGSAGASGSTDGIGTAAKFNLPSGITTDGTYLYVVDYGNSTIRQIVIATGAVTTLAGTAGSTGSTDGIGATARFFNPQGITLSGANLFVTDTNNYTIRKIVISTRNVTTLAGSAGIEGPTDGTGAAARFYYPKGITTDGINLFLADTSNEIIRKVVISTGVVTTLAGTAGISSSTDGTGTAAKFDAPTGITMDGVNLFITDAGSGKIRRVVIATCVVTTIAGSHDYGFTDGRGAAARFSGPTKIATDGTSLFIADTVTIRKVEISTAVVTTLAGSAGNPGVADGTGSAARFAYLSGITTDGTNLYVTDQGNSTIRQVEISTGTVTTLAGNAGIRGSSDGTGSDARFNRPSDITTDGANLYVSDYEDAVIRKVVIATGAVTTVAGTTGIQGSTDGTGTAASFWFPYGITTDGICLFIVDSGTIRKMVISTAAVTTIAGSATDAAGSADGTGATARFFAPSGITTDGANLYVADSGNRTIRKIVIATGVVTTLAGTAGNTGYADGMGASARFNWPNGITTDGASLFVTDRDNYSIRKIN